jgi:hypothetical protein
VKRPCPTLYHNRGARPRRHDTANVCRGSGFLAAHLPTPAPSQNSKNLSGMMRFCPGYSGGAAPNSRIPCAPRRYKSYVKNYNSYIQFYEEFDEKFIFIPRAMFLRQSNFFIGAYQATTPFYVTFFKHLLVYQVSGTISDQNQCVCAVTAD